MSRMGQWILDQQEIAAASGVGLDYLDHFSEWIASRGKAESNKALPAHKQGGYAESMYDRADGLKKQSKGE